MSLTVTIVQSPFSVEASITQHEGKHNCMKYTVDYLYNENDNPPMYFANELLRDPAAKRFIGTAKYTLVLQSENKRTTVYAVELYNKRGIEIDKPLNKAKDRYTKKDKEYNPPIVHDLFELHPIITIIVNGEYGRAILKGKFNDRYTVYEKYFNDIDVLETEQTIVYNFLIDNDVIQFIGTNYKLYVIDSSRNFCAGLGETRHTRYLIVY